MDNVFAPTTTKPTKKRMSGPYFLPANDGDESEPITFVEYESGGVWPKAKAFPQSTQT